MEDLRLRGATLIAGARGARHKAQGARHGASDATGTNGTHKVNTAAIKHAVIQKGRHATLTNDSAWRPQLHVGLH